MGQNTSLLTDIEKAKVEAFLEQIVNDQDPPMKDRVRLLSSTTIRHAYLVPNQQGWSPLGMDTWPDSLDAVLCKWLEGEGRELGRAVACACNIYIIKFLA